MNNPNINCNDIIYRNNKTMMNKIMIRPYDNYIGKTILFGKYNEVVDAWYCDIDALGVTDRSIVTVTTFGNYIELKRCSTGSCNNTHEFQFSSDDIIFASHCHDGYIRIWFACDPKDILNDYIEIAFTFATPVDYVYINLEEQPEDRLDVDEDIQIYDETFDVIIPMDLEYWERNYDQGCEKPKYKFIISHTGVNIDTDIVYTYTSKVRDFIHCVVPMEGYILIEAYDIPIDRGFIRLSVSITNT